MSPVEELLSPTELIESGNVTQLRGPEGQQLRDLKMNILLETWSKSFQSPELSKFNYYKRSFLVDILSQLPWLEQKERALEIFKKLIQSVEIPRIIENDYQPFPPTRTYTVKVRYHFKGPGKPLGFGPSN